MDRNKFKLEVRHFDAIGPKKATLLFIHGAWLSAWNWEPFFIPYFTNLGYECTALSLRGHGNSQGSLNFSITSDYVADVHEVAQSLDSPILIGHSLGGLIAQLYAAQYPVRGLALLASVPPAGLMGITLRTAISHPLKLLKCFATWSLFPIVEDKDIARALLFSRGPTQNDKDSYVARLKSESFLAFITGLLPVSRKAAANATKKLVIGAKEDRAFTKKEMMQTANFYGVDPHFVEGSHMLMLEDSWHETAALIEQWLARNF